MIANRPGQIKDVQTRCFLRAFLQALQKLSGGIDRLKTVDFSWVGGNGQEGVMRDGGKISDVTATFSKRNPFHPLPEDKEGTLIVAMYAWDGNSLPGEYLQV